MTYVDVLLKKFASRGVLIDTNLLVLFIVGSYDASLIGPDGFKRTRSYSEKDYKLLRLFVSRFRVRVTTPHVLTEVSNLIGQLFGEKKSACLEGLSREIHRVDEIALPSRKASQREEFTFLGLTDSALAELAGEYLVLTDDARCAKALNDSRLDALNFTNLRTYLF